MSPRTNVQRGAAPGATWEAATREPAPALRGHVRRLVGYDERTAGPLARAELPSAGVTVILETGPSLRVREPADLEPRAHRGGFVAGPSDHATHTEHDGWQQGIQLDLSPLAARRIFGVPLHNLARRVTPLDDLLPPSLRAMPERLAEADTWSARLDEVERWLLDRLSRAAPADPRVAWAAGQIERSDGTADIRALSTELGVSRKHLVSLFRQHVGIPPKLHARLVRFDRLAAHIRRSAPPSWAQIAAALGYCDQAHLARDVRALAGMTPTELRALLRGAGSG